MSSTNDFISELVRAANEVEKLSGTERAQLLDRAVRTIRDLREQIHRWPSSNVRDAVFGLERAATASRTGERDHDRTKAALLDAASMIRDLHIVLDTGTEIRAEQG